MGAFIARQPNGLLCRWSSVVDDITHFNMTEEEYVNLCAERARQEAYRDLHDKQFVRPFREIEKAIEFQLTSLNNQIENPKEYELDDDKIADIREQIDNLQVVLAQMKIPHDNETATQI